MTTTNTITRRQLTAKLKAQSIKIKRLQARLAMSSAAFLNIVGNNTKGVIILDEHKMILYINYVAITLFDRNIARLLSEPLPLEWQDITDNTPTEICIPKDIGQQTIAEMSVLKTEWNHQPCFILSFLDITERKKSEALLEHCALHDHLTGLPNRKYLENQMNKSIQSAHDHQQHMAIVYLDLDHFKHINDSFGHTTGDQILQIISKLLLDAVRRGDTVARIGGDEFIIVLDALRKPEYAAVIVQTILDKIAKPIQLEHQDMVINASAGIAVYPFCGTTAPTLLLNADTALYRAKIQGKNQYHFFTQSLCTQSHEALSIINGFRNMLHNHELFLEFQPIYTLSNRMCTGIEVLLRWQHPTLGILYPKQFLPFISNKHLLLEMRQWMLEQAFKDYKALNCLQDFGITIALSTNELCDETIETFILSTLNESAIPALNLRIKLSEPVIQKERDPILTTLNHLSDVGIQLAINDYGPEYTFLNVLKQQPMNRLNIYKICPSDLYNDTHNRIILKSSVELAHNLGLKVMVEGVENDAQLAFLKSLSCDEAQGPYFSNPLLFQDLVDYLQNIRTTQTTSCTEKV